MSWYKQLLLCILHIFRPAVKETVDVIVEEGLDKLEDELNE